MASDLRSDNKGVRTSVATLLLLSSAAFGGSKSETYFSQEYPPNRVPMGTTWAVACVRDPFGTEQSCELRVFTLADDDTPVSFFFSKLVEEKPSISFVYVTDKAPTHATLRVDTGTVVQGNTKKGDPKTGKFIDSLSLTKDEAQKFISELRGGHTLYVRVTRAKQQVNLKIPLGAEFSNAYTAFETQRLRKF